MIPSKYNFNGRLLSEAGHCQLVLRLTIIKRSAAALLKHSTGFFFSQLFIFTWAFILTATEVLANESELEKQRDTFLKAEYSAKKHSRRQFQYLYKKLGDYPLKPYAMQRFLIRHPYISYEPQITEFLDEFSNTPLEGGVREAWLKYLARKDEAKRFLRDYRSGYGAKMDCYYWRFKKQLEGETPEFFEAVGKLWLVGKSQPKACDPLFDRWTEKGLMSNAMIMRRIELAATEGNHTLIPYLKTLLPKHQQYLADLWRNVRQNPKYMAYLKRFPNRDPQEKYIALYGIKRLIWRDKKQGLATWEKMQQRFQLTELEKGQVAYRFAIRLAAASDKRASEWLAKVPTSLVDDTIVHWRVADMLRNQEWQSVLKLLQGLPEPLAQKPAWRYWKGRALIELNRVQEGEIILDSLAQLRHYYGFLAASRLNKPPKMENKALSFSLSEMQRVAKSKAWLRAIELRKLRRYSQARREWNAWLDNITDQETLIAAKLAYDNGWFDRAIFALPQVGYMDDVDLRFPLAYQDEVRKHAKTYKLDPAFTFAIARRESSFMHDAYSDAGAVGLMQVLPSTVKFITKKRVKSQSLFNAEKNLGYGTRYLSYLMKETDNNPVLTTASYNAGIFRVKKWVRYAQPADIWIETIPFKETREYVKSVMAYRQIYIKQLGRSDNVFEEIVKMTIGEDARRH